MFYNMTLVLSLAALGGSLLALAFSIFTVGESLTVKIELLALLASLATSVWLGYRRWQEHTHSLQDIIQLRTSMQMANEHMLQCLNEAHVTQENLRSEASHDALTGLLNRRLLDDTLYREVTRAIRQLQTLSAVMIDIDHFKQLNDRYGHPAGDQVLKALAEVICAQARSSDMAFRYGGEEFLILLPNMPRTTALERAETWRKACEEILVRFEGQEIRFTISAGVCSLPDHADSALNLVACADQALYKAKNTGRNRVCLFGQT